MKYLSLIAFFLFANVLQAQELLVCSETVGSSKTKCEAPKLIKSASFASTFSVFYDYVCKYNMTPNVPVLSPSLDPGSTFYQFQIGNGRRIDVPEATQLVFRFLNDKQPMLHKDCSLKINQIKQGPSPATLALWKKEAQRLQELLIAKAEHYRHVVDTDLFIDNYTLEKLRGMQADMQAIFNQTIILALTRSDIDAPPGQEKLPADYGLGIETWEQLDVFVLKMIMLKENQPRYEIKLDSTKLEQRWYFEAMETLPVVSDLLSQLAIVAEARLMKQQAQDSGYTLPDKNQVRSELQALITEAQTFLHDIQDFRNELLTQVQALEQTLSQADTNVSRKR